MALLRREFSRIRWGMTALAAAGTMTVLTLAATQAPVLDVFRSDSAPAAGPAIAAGPSPALAELATDHPRKRVEVIVQLLPGADAQATGELIRSHGGRVTGRLPIINGLAAKLSALDATRLAESDGVKAVSINAAVRQSSIDEKQLETSFNQSIDSADVWKKPGVTGKGVGVAVIDTGVAGGLPDFRVSQTDSRSRVLATAVTNPYANTAEDKYGHGTHVAGIIAGNGSNRPNSDPLYGKYAGVAPDANLISVKVSDDAGDTSVLDVIYGLQFVVDHKNTHNIRVVNLSLESTQAESYKTDPLDAAVESAWLKGIVVVVAAGNRGTASDAARYAPANDPYVITVGAVDDSGTKKTKDDELTSWSSRGTTQDGFQKPEVTAPGAHIVSVLAPESEFASLCPSCIVSGKYLRIGGTSMAAPMVAGAAALMLEADPSLTPNQVKGALVETTRNVAAAGHEIDVQDAIKAGDGETANDGLTPNTLVDATTGEIDYTRSRWSRSRWSTAPSSLGASWARSRWSCVCYSSDSATEVQNTRSRWSRSRWSWSPSL